MNHSAEVGKGALQGERILPSVYSVVFTSDTGKKGFEMFLLRGELPHPAQIEDDLRRALERLSVGGLLQVGESHRG